MGLRPSAAGLERAHLQPGSPLKDDKRPVFVFGVVFGMGQARASPSGCH